MTDSTLGIVANRAPEPSNAYRLRLAEHLVHAAVARWPEQTITVSRASAGTITISNGTWAVQLDRGSTSAKLSDMRPGKHPIYHWTVPLAGPAPYDTRLIFARLTEKGLM